MDQVTQTNAAGAEESASAAQELNAQSTMMRLSVQQLERLVGSKNNTPAADVAIEEPIPEAAPRQFIKPTPSRIFIRPRPASLKAASDEAVASNANSQLDPFFK
jgi:methyl-accepting chemotaxis protein